MDLVHAFGEGGVFGLPSRFPPCRFTGPVCFRYDSLYDSPFPLFLAIPDASGDSSDEENEEDEDDFACIQFGSRYSKNPA